MTAPSPFDLAGPLPTGSTLLEASAGTGKTYTIAALTARYIAEEGLDVSRLLLVTFGRHAASELRARIFGRLTQTIAALDAVLAGHALPDPHDEVSALLAGTDAAVHRDRLAEAVARFNEATVLTTHSFCQAMLSELGILGDWDPSETVGPDPAELMTQCTTDAYLQRYLTDSSPAVTPKEALQIGRAACETTLPLAPSAGPHVEFATRVRQIYSHRKTVQGLCTYNDIVGRLRALLESPGTGPAVADALHRRFAVVLVDEFQDTDPDQWAILDRAFVSGGTPTVLIGDPKQSIYAFRGADLQSYLAAKGAATVHTLTCNRRSDRPLVDGVVELFGAAPLGDASVTVLPVGSQHGSRMSGLAGQARLWIREGKAGRLDGRSPAAAIDEDLVLTISRLLELARLPDGAGGTRAVELSDIAVLVRRGARAHQLRTVLEAAGYPAVLTGSQSVWEQPAAAEWATLLRAMAEPTQATIRLAALTSLIGSDLADMLTDGSVEPARVSVLVRALARRFADSGVAGVFTALRTSEHLDARVLGERDGERHLADLAHIAELLDGSGESTLSALIALCERPLLPEEGGDAIRVAGDEQAIRVMTIHAAKGLEFPLVLLPETEGVQASRKKPFSIVTGGRRHLYVGPAPDWRDELAQDLDAQNLAEELRLLYVGLTRARHLSVAWHVAPERAPSVAKRPMALLLDRLDRRSNGATAAPVLWVHRSPISDRQELQRPVIAREEPALRLGTLRRSIDTTWRRTSYSGLTQSLHEQQAPHLLSDEAAEVDVAPPAASDPALDAPSPMTALPAGPAFGTLVHEALELLDWTPGRLAPHAQAVMDELAPQHGLDPERGAVLASALVAVCTTPLLPLTANALTDIPLARRLPELDFDLPLADRGAAATLAQLAALMAAHLPASDPLAEYPARLAASEAADAVLNGFLTGSIDAVLQLDDGRFLVVDYKTNRLAPAGETGVTVGHYIVPAMAEAMMQAHYPLQAMLYCVALHRYLSTRLPGYSASAHLGGVGYLFVRGMAGPDTPVVAGTACGVMAWHPPAPLVEAVSDLLEGHHA